MISIMENKTAEGQEEKELSRADLHRLLTYTALSGRYRSVALGLHRAPEIEDEESLQIASTFDRLSTSDDDTDIYRLKPIETEIIKRMFGLDTDGQHGRLHRVAKDLRSQGKKITRERVKNHMYDALTKIKVSYKKEFELPDWAKAKS